MRGLRLVVILGVLLAVVATNQPACAYQEFIISCEGTRCNGGGAWHYQYTLQNISGAPVTLQEFILGTHDSNGANYTYMPTPGFTASVVPNGVPSSVTYTTTVETAHGVVPPQFDHEPSAANVWWVGSSVIPHQGTITFGFDHPNIPWDHEWFAVGSGATEFTVGMVDSPIAGPTGVFTDGWVHAPSPYPAQEGCCTLLMENCSTWVPPSSGTGCAVLVVAQSFMPLEDYELCRVDVVLQYEDTVTLYVQDDPTDNPGTIYTQATRGGISNEAWYEFDVPDVALVAGTEYYIRVVGDVSWKEDDSNPYPRGMAYQDGTPLEFRDHFFKTYTYTEQTRVEMAAMNARGYDGFVQLEWTTETEIDHAGFHVNRSLSEDGPFARISRGLLAARGDELTGETYSFVDRDVVNGTKYYYEIVSLDLSGETATYGPIAATAGAERSPRATGFVLEQNYPDPFNPITEIRYYLVEGCQVRVDVYNVLGQRVATLVDEEQTAGTKVASWTAGPDLPGGAYFCTLRAGSFFDTRKMVLLR
jgi:hypothetical protein